jgi:hypothetical protein
VRFSIDVDGERAFSLAFDNVRERITDLRPSWPTVAKEFFEIEQDLFRSGGTSGASGRWAPLSREYEERKVARFGSFALFSGVLIRTEAMYKALTRKGSPHQVYDEQADSLTVGTDLPYPRAHMKKWKNRPARPPISLTDKDRERLREALRRGLADFVKREGFVQTSISEMA